MLCLMRRPYLAAAASHACSTRRVRAAAATALLPAAVSLDAYLFAKLLSG